MNVVIIIGVRVVMTSQQSEIWAVKGTGTHRKCPKLGIFITDCMLNKDCNICIKEDKKDVKTDVRGQKRPKRR